MNPQTCIRHLSRQSLQCSQLIIEKSKIIIQYKNWNNAFRGKVKPYYAVKCNPLFQIINELNSLNSGFDCASWEEIKNVQNINPNAPIIYANPVKPIDDLYFAYKSGVRLVTVDCIEEMDKFHNLPGIEIIIRLSVNDNFSKCKFNSKFGASFEEMKKIVKKAKLQQNKISGFSFHVGSSCSSIIPYQDAILQCKSAFDVCKSHGFNDVKILDIGGGFLPHDDEVSIYELGRVILQTIETNFDQNHNLKIIGEPGRFLVGNAATLITNVIGKKESIVDNHPLTKYYIDNGVYGLLNCQIYDYNYPKFTIQTKDNNNSLTSSSTIFGPTCDSLDIIRDSIQLPQLQLGDKIIFHDMGAYTNAASTYFNGLNSYKLLYI